MRVALISDIHANLVAFNTVLAEVEGQQVDRVICLGDVAASGPQPQETIERLKEIDCLVVMGNADAWLLNPVISKTSDERIRQYEQVDMWCSQQLSRYAKDYIRTFQKKHELALASDLELLCYHGSPQSNEDIVLATTPDEQIQAMFAGFDARLMAGGHTHQQMLRRYNNKLILNPGSVGLPFEISTNSGAARNPAWAEYALVDASNGGLSVDFRRVPVDKQAIKQAILASGMPYAERWAASRS